MLFLFIKAEEFERKDLEKQCYNAFLAFKEVKIRCKDIKLF